jgi:hypothetical protein
VPLVDLSMVEQRYDAVREVLHRCPADGPSGPRHCRRCTRPCPPTSRMRLSDGAERVHLSIPFLANLCAGQLVELLSAALSNVAARFGWKFRAPNPQQPPPNRRFEVWILRRLVG